jgi:hypothetical protein
LARQRHLQEIHDHQDDYWHQVDQAVMRSSGTGYDEAVRLLIELRAPPSNSKRARHSKSVSAPGSGLTCAVPPSSSACRLTSSPCHKRKRYWRLVHPNVAAGRRLTNRRRRALRR